MLTRAGKRQSDKEKGQNSPSCQAHGQCTAPERSLTCCKPTAAFPDSLALLKFLHENFCLQGQQILQQPPGRCWDSFAPMQLLPHSLTLIHPQKKSGKRDISSLALRAIRIRKCFNPQIYVRCIHCTCEATSSTAWHSCEKRQGAEWLGAV